MVTNVEELKEFIETNYCTGGICTECLIGKESIKNNEILTCGPVSGKLTAIKLLRQLEK